MALGVLAARLFGVGHLVLGAGGMIRFFTQDYHPGYDWLGDTTEISTSPAGIQIVLGVLFLFCAPPHGSRSAP